MGNISTQKILRPKTIPVVVVLGATACGKSRLAIELAQKFNGEIISADSIQVYKGLDIVTNKVTQEEKRLAKHHMIDVADPSQTYSVVDFQSKSLKLVDSLIGEGKIPIVVGGTHYYIESILWEQFIIQRDDSEGRESQQTKGKDARSLIDNELQTMAATHKDLIHSEEDLTQDRILKKPIYLDSFKGVPNEKLWNILEQLDPVSANSYHPNDTRRILRALQILQQEKRRMTDIIKEKNTVDDRFSRGGRLRYVPTCVFWLYCDKEVLRKRLDARIEEMLEKGLIQELEDFHDDYISARMKEGLLPDYTRGVFQTIGLKEFHDYLTLPDKKSKLSEEGEKLLRKCKYNMKISTRRYANKQLRWITRRMLEQGTRDLPPIFKLDVTKVLNGEEDWDESIRPIADRVVQSILNETKLPSDVLPYLQEPEVRWDLQHLPGKFICESCDKTFIGTYQWSVHCRSRKHSKRLASLKKKTSEVATLAGKREDEAIDVDSAKISSC